MVCHRGLRGGKVAAHATEVLHPSRVRDECGPTLAALKEASERWAVQERHRPRVSSGVEVVDQLLGGGWLVGKVGELVGPASSGKTSVAVATVAQATRRGELCLWVDACGQLDVASWASWGVWLDGVLVVRVREGEQAVRAVELVVAAGGITTVVVDVAGRERGTAKGHLPLRLARAVEHAGAVGLVLSESPWMGTWASTRLVFSPGLPRFIGAEEGLCWLAGWQLQVTLQRGQGLGAGKRLGAAAGA